MATSRRGRYDSTMSAVEPPADYFRFCPGEEHVKISNAICRGRRRAHFPKCQACQFNEDLRGQPVPPGGSERARSVSLIESTFRRFDILGATPDPISIDAAWRIGHATAQYVHGRLRGLDRADPNIRCMVIGRDVRPSSEELTEAVIAGVHSTGLDVIDIGVIDTPQLFFAVNHLGACGGIQTTGGRHGPAFNGFKLCAAKALPIAADTGLLSIRDIASRVPRHDSGTHARHLPRDLSVPYGEFVRRPLAGGGPARPLKVVVDAAGGCAARWVPIVFEGVRNLTIIPLRFDDAAVSETDVEAPPAQRHAELRRAVKQHAADLGVAFDADADRCGFVDEKAAAVPTDLVAALVARRLLEREPGSTVVFDHRFSKAAHEEIGRVGGVVVRERVGHPLIKKTMLQRHALMGADLGGRFYFRDNFFCESALLAMVQVLNLLGESGRGLGELSRPLNRYRTSGELRFACADVERVLAQITATHVEAEVDQLDGVTVRYPEWWFNVRQGEQPSELRVMVEAGTRKLVEQRVAELGPMLGSKL